MTQKLSCGTETGSHMVKDNGCCRLLASPTLVTIIKAKISKSFPTDLEGWSKSKVNNEKPIRVLHGEKFPMKILRF